jgi:hypothetical protein
MKRFWFLLLLFAPFAISGSGLSAAASGSLNITEPAVTPEPPMLVCLIAGVLLMGLVELIRRR